MGNDATTNKGTTSHVQCIVLLTNSKGFHPPRSNNINGHVKVKVPLSSYHSTWTPNATRRKIGNTWVCKWDYVIHKKLVDVMEKGKNLHGINKPNSFFWFIDQGKMRNFNVNVFGHHLNTLDTKM
jgi:hypothetical protein